MRNLKNTNAFHAKSNSQRKLIRDFSLFSDIKHLVIPFAVSVSQDGSPPILTTTDGAFDR